MPRPKRADLRRYAVTVRLPEGCSSTRMREYILDAVSSWSGSYEPSTEFNNWEGDPLFDLDRDSITVRPLGAPKEKGP